MGGIVGPLMLWMMENVDSHAIATYGSKENALKILSQRCRDELKASKEGLDDLVETESMLGGVEAEVLAYLESDDG